MKCPYCAGEMIKGQIRTTGSISRAIYWKDTENEFDLNTEPCFTAYMNGARIDACCCTHCKKIIIDYKT